MKIPVVAAVAGGALLAVGALFMMGAATRVVELPPEVGAQAFVDCARLTSGAEVTSETVALECTLEALEGVAAQGGLSGLDSALWDAEQVDPRVIQLCHSLTHGVSHSAYVEAETRSPGSGLEELKGLFRRDSSGCHGAVMHGSLEAWVAGGPTVEDFRDLVAACVEQPPGLSPEEQGRDAARSGRCADALGHAVWNVWEDPTNCSLFTDMAQQVNCSGGVVMQMYRPVGESRPVEGVEFEDLIELCRRWPSEVNVNGCNIGVAYAFDHLVSDTMAQMGDSLRVGATLTDDQRKTISQALKEARGWCAELPNDPERLCEAGLLVGDALYALDPSVPRELCAELSPKRVEGCQLRFVRGRG